MKILAFDTTNNSMSVAVICANKLVANKDILESGLQAEKLIPTIEECLNEADIWYQDLDLLAIKNVQGRFTKTCSKNFIIAANICAYIYTRFS